MFGGSATPCDWTVTSDPQRTVTPDPPAFLYGWRAAFFFMWKRKSFHLTKSLFSCVSLFLFFIKSRKRQQNYYFFVSTIFHSRNIPQNVWESPLGNPIESHSLQREWRKSENYTFQLISTTRAKYEIFVLRTWMCVDAPVCSVIRSSDNFSCYSSKLCIEKYTSDQLVKIIVTFSLRSAV